jgi:hypothetical protein
MIPIRRVKDLVNFMKIADADIVKDFLARASRVMV